MNKYLDAALAADAAGLSVMPPKQDGSKMPDTSSWTAYHVPNKKTNTVKRETPETIPEFYTNGRTGVGIFTGAPSKNTELFEFDCRDTYTLFLEAATNVGLGDVIDRIRAGYEEETPGGGIHWLTRCTDVSGNTALAKRPKRPEEQRHPKDKAQVLIETRGTGGYAVLAPSDGEVHPTHRGYELKSGGFDTIATITPEERRELWNLARSFDRMPVKQPFRPKPTPADGTPGERPGDIYNQRATWAEVLEPHGWAFVYERNRIAYWRRPGKERGISATTNATGRDTLIVFSSSTDFDVSPSSYDRFSAYALLNHSGDFTAAAKALYAEGFRPSRADVVWPPDDEPDQPDSLPDSPPEKPLIQTSGDFLTNIAGKTIAALQLANEQRPRLFVRAGALTHIRRDEHERPVIEALSKDALLVHTARAAHWQRWDERMHEPKKTSPPDDVLRYIMARGAWPFPPLAGLTEVPVLRPDGSLLTEPGYDEATRLMYAPATTLTVPAIPDAPTPDDVAAALALLHDLLADFPFDSEASRTNALALVLTSVIRPAIVGPAPLALIDKNVPGAGATLLAEVIGTLALGRAPGLTSAPKDEEEMEKRTTTLLRDGETFIVLDNVDRPLDYSSLSLVLTASEWVGRILGRSESARYPNRATWVATGVNLSVRGDVARRAYQIRMIAPEAQPWRSEGDVSRYRHPDILEYALTHRGALVAAALTLARAWFAAGEPKAKTPKLGKFESWCQIVGGILAHAGVSGFLGNLDQLYEQVDAEAPEWEGFLRAWRTHWRSMAASPAEVTRVLRSAESGTPATGGRKADPEDDEGPTTLYLFREALPADLADALTNPRGSFERSLGKALAKRVDRRYGNEGHRIVRTGTAGRTRWLVQVDPTPAPNRGESGPERGVSAGLRVSAGLSEPKQENWQSQDEQYPLSDNGAADNGPGETPENPQKPANPQGAPDAFERAEAASYPRVVLPDGRTLEGQAEWVRHLGSLSQAARSALVVELLAQVPQEATP